MRHLKKSLALLSVSLLLVSLYVSPAMAKSKTVSGTLAGYSCSVYVNVRASIIGSNGKTSYGTNAGVAVTTTSYCETADGYKWDTIVSSNSANSTSVSATATIPSNLLKIGYLLTKGKANGTITNGTTWTKSTDWVLVS